MEYRFVLFGIQPSSSECWITALRDPGFPLDATSQLNSLNQATEQLRHKRHSKLTLPNIVKM